MRPYNIFCLNLFCTITNGTIKKWFYLYRSYKVSNDTIHQMSNVFTYETNKHLTDLYNSGVYLKPKMDQIEFEKKSKYLVWNTDEKYSRNTYLIEKIHIYP